jgi:DNA invertase Pin-like site-specific DNA recombinase
MGERTLRRLISRRLTLNALPSFAQVEREVTSERIRGKIAASKRKWLWVGGPLPCVCREFKLGRSGGEVRLGWRAT